ncbi:hypothetical protein MAHJHV57_52170 [Mycobacterium avium subsp. hominissuis]
MRSATVADLTVAGERDRLPIELASAVLVLVVLLVVYRSAVTMLLPLVTILLSLVIALRNTMDWLDTPEPVNCE